MIRFLSLPALQRSPWLHPAVAACTGSAAAAWAGASTPGCAGRIEAARADGVLTVAP